MIAFCPGFSFESFVIITPFCKTILVKINLVTNFEKMSQTSPIHFYFENINVDLKQRGKLKAFLAGLISKEKKGLADLSYIFCTDKNLLKINRNHLGHDFYTDVITFDLSSSSNEILADVYISAERVKANSKTLNRPFKEELHRVMLHGLLHLCGYNDKTQVQKQVMRAKEDFYLDLYFKRFT
jgi:probable rRNA maturation factor